MPLARQREWIDEVHHRAAAEGFEHLVVGCGSNETWRGIEPRRREWREEVRDEQIHHTMNYVVVARAVCPRVLSWESSGCSTEQATVWRALDVILQHPVLDNALVQGELGVSVMGADAAITELVAVGVLNQAKAGQTVRLKWRLTTADGLPVTDLDPAGVRVTVTGLSCSVGSTVDVVEEYSTGSSGLQNLGDGYCQWNWKTARASAGSCKTMTLSLGESVNVIHDALFTFTDRRFPSISRSIRPIFVLGEGEPISRPTRARRSIGSVVR